MANIPIERKAGGGFPWWAWLLLGLLVLGMILVFARGCNPDDPARTGALVTDTSRTAATAPAAATGTAAGAATGGTITSIEELFRARQGRSLLGRDVELRNVVATELAGDSTFFVANPSNPQDRVLVVLEDLGESVPDPSGPQGSDGRYNINPGEQMTVYGRVDRFAGRERAVSGANRSRLLPDSLYVNARRITSSTDQVLSRPDGSRTP